jgi:sporulation protein YqfC
MKKKRFYHRLIDAAELPQDLDPHLFFVQWLGVGEVLIEQHRGILRLEDSAIRFRTEQGVLTVSGESLEMTVLTESRSLISGSVTDVSLEVKS